MKVKSDVHNIQKLREFTPSRHAPLKNTKGSPEGWN